MRTLKHMNIQIREYTQILRIHENTNTKHEYTRTHENMNTNTRIREYMNT